MNGNGWKSTVSSAIGGVLVAIAVGGFLQVLELRDRVATLEERLRGRAEFEARENQAFRDRLDELEGRRRRH